MGLKADFEKIFYLLTNRYILCVNPSGFSLEEDNLTLDLLSLTSGLVGPILKRHLWNETQGANPTLGQKGMLKRPALKIIILEGETDVSLHRINV